MQFHLQNELMVETDDAEVVVVTGDAEVMFAEMEWRQ